MAEWSKAKNKNPVETLMLQESTARRGFESLSFH